MQAYRVFGAHRIFGASLALCGVLACGATPAHAANRKVDTLTATCDNGQTMTVEIESSGKGAFPSGLHVVESTSVFTIHQITITSHATGESFTVKNADGVDNNKQLISCFRAGNDYDFTWTGFFTPSG
jgi:hypothetical protein